MQQLKQKNWSATKEIIIENDCLNIKTKNFKEELEYKIKFDELGFEIFKKREKVTVFPFIFFVSFTLVYIGFSISSFINNEPFGEQMFWIFATGLFMALAIVVYSKRNKDLVYLTGGRKSLELMTNKPDKQSVNLFIESIHKAMRQYYKDKYCKFENDITYEVRMHRLKWLKEIQVLTEKEFDELVEETKTVNIIGFQRQNEKE